MYTPASLSAANLAAAVPLPGQKDTHIQTLKHKNLTLLYTARNYGPSVAHAAAGRRTSAGDEAHDGLVGVAVLLQPLRRILFRLSTNLSDHYYSYEKLKSFTIHQQKYF